VDFVFPEFGQAVGQLGRVFFPSADETISGDDNGDFEAGVFFHISACSILQRPRQN
jgi:hypothetical protein